MASEAIDAQLRPQPDKRGDPTVVSYPEGEGEACVVPVGATDDASPTGDVTIPAPLTAAAAAHRWTCVARLAVVVSLPAALAMYGLAAGDLGCSAYSVTRSTCDVAGAALLYAAGVAFLLWFCTARERRGLFDNKLPITDVIHHFSVVYFIATTTKCWVFKWNADDGSPIFGTLLVVSATASSVVAMVANYAIHRCDIPASVNLHFHSVVRILRPYFWPAGVSSKALIVSTWLLMGAGKAAGVVAPLYLAKAVSNIQANESPYSNLAIFGVLMLAPRVLEELQDMLVIKIWRIAYIQVASEAFEHVHKLSLEWHLAKKMGHVIRYMDRGMNAAQELVQYVAMYVGPALLVAVSAFVVFATEFKQPKVAAVSWMFMAMYVWITIVVTIWRKIFFQQANEHDNAMHDRATDSLINFETVKYFTNEKLEHDNYISSVGEFQRNEQNSRFSVGVLNMAQASIMETCRMVALMVAATAVMDREEGFDLGQFMALQSYLAMVFTPFQFLGSIYESAVQSLIDMENLSELLAQKPDLVDGPDAKPLEESTAPCCVPPKECCVPPSDCCTPPRSIGVEFRDVSFHYPSQSASAGLKHVSFTVAAGTTTALVGTTGSGKTTVTRLLFRFYDVLDGAVLVDGRDVRDITQRSLRQHIGIVPQDTVLFNDTIRHNVRYGRPDATDEEVTEAARRAQLLPLIDRLEKGWDTVVGERGLKLSGGEKQRVAIARCLLKNPPIVVLDEATSALDNKTEREVQEALKSLDGRTTIVVAHRLSTVQHADQIIVLHLGRIVERGSFAELMAKPDSEFSAMWHAQAHPVAATPSSPPPTSDS